MPTAKIYKRKLSHGLSRRCGNAEGKMCHCRCNGKLHGIDHEQYRVAEAALFEQKRALKEDVTETDIFTLIAQVEAALKPAPASEATA